MAFTLAKMKDFAIEAWGPDGGKIVDKWVDLNKLYFDGKLKPVPLVLTHTQPFGKRIAFCSYNPGTHGRTITLNVPKTTGHGHYQLVADNNGLLHEMVHQFLFERGEDAAHAGGPWRREIMRLNRMIAGREIWAGRSKTIRDPSDMKRVIRINEPKEEGKPSLKQSEIACWPMYCHGISLGKLGL
jgi:hypothetical protein